MPPAPPPASDHSQAGSLGPVSGRVIGLPNAVAHKACVYLESASATFNGPKPFEDEGSSSPVDAAGRFNYVAWWANAMCAFTGRGVEPAVGAVRG